MLSRPISSNRQPSRDGLPSPPRSAARTNQDAPARSPVPASTFPRHYPCQQRLISPVGSNVSGRFSMAGFEVTLYGRIWVTPKARDGLLAVFEVPRPRTRNALPNRVAVDRFRRNSVL